MGNKTSQLQVRVSPEQKDALKRLAAEAGLNVSQYVLSRALPAQGRALAEKTGSLAASDDRSDALSELATYLLGLEGDALAEAIAVVDLDSLPSLLRTYVASVVELVAGARGIPAPPWVSGLAPLDRPHFARDLWSLHGHQLRTTPVTFKRRNAFLDVEGIDALQRSLPEVPPADGMGPGVAALPRLADFLADAEVLAELCLVGGAVVGIVYAAFPGTRRVTAMLGADPTLREAAARVASERGLEPGWLDGAVSTALGSAGGGRPARFVELPGLRAYHAPAGYVFAVRCAALSLGVDPMALRDIRYLMRYLGIWSAERGVDVAGRYLAPRHLPSGLYATLDDLLAA